MKIKAAVARAPHTPLSIEELTIDEPRADEVLVRNVAVGICHTDIIVRDQFLPVPLPLVLGHEGSGVVEAVGSAVTKVSVGDHVVMSYDSCGNCSTCHSHAPTYCDDFMAHNFGGSRPGDGSCNLHAGEEVIHSNFFGQSSFATHSIARDRNVVKVSKDTPLEKLGPLACGIQTGAGAIINVLQVGFGDSIAVFGAGAVGMSAIMAAKAVGAATIIAVDINDERLDQSRSFGATHTINGKQADDVVEEIKRMTNGGVNFGFDSTGVAELVQNGILSLRAKGVYATVGSYPPEATASINLLDFFTQGKSFKGLVEGESNADKFIPELIELNQQGRFPYDDLIKFYDFADINVAMEEAEAGKVLKPVIRF